MSVGGGGFLPRAFEVLDFLKVMQITGKSFKLLLHEICEKFSNRGWKKIIKFL